MIGYLIDDHVSLFLHQNVFSYNPHCLTPTVREHLNALVGLAITISYNTSSCKKIFLAQNARKFIILISTSLQVNLDPVFILNFQMTRQQFQQENQRTQFFQMLNLTIDLQEQQVIRLVCVTKTERWRVSYILLPWCEKFQNWQKNNFLMKFHLQPPKTSFLNCCILSDMNSSS